MYTAIANVRPENQGGIRFRVVDVSKNVCETELSPGGTQSRKPAMDNLNKKAYSVLEKKGEKKFVEHVFTHPDDHDKKPEEKRQLSYAEMRMLYG